ASRIVKIVGPGPVSRQITSTRTSMTSPSVRDSMKLTALETTSLARRPSLATQATAKVARCHRSPWSTSATETLKRCFTFSLRPRRTCRLPFSESTSLRCSSTSPRATLTTSLLRPRPDLSQRAGDLLGGEHLEDVADLDVGHALHAD